MKMLHRCINRRIVVFVAIALSLSSCSEMMVGNARVYGRVGDVSRADIDAAIAADRAASRRADFEVIEIEVVSHDEIWIYHERRMDAGASHSIMKRVHGRWRFFRAPIILV